MEIGNKKFIIKRNGQKSARSSLFSGSLLLFVSILLFSFTPVKAGSFDEKTPCCGSPAEMSSDPELSGRVFLSESCQCCRGICRCNFNTGIPVNDTDVNVSPRSVSHGDQQDAVSQREYFTLKYESSAEWRASLLIDYGESVPLYLLKSSLLFYH